MRIGLSLKQRREELKLELSDVAKSTHIRTDYIRLIENGQAATLPVAPIYTRSYVKSLCRTYNLDFEPLVAQLIPELPQEPLLATASQRALVLEAATDEQPESAAEPAASPSSGHAMRWLVISLVMVVAAVVLVTAISRNVRRNIPVSDAPPVTSADLQQYLVPELLEPTALDVPR
jgi:cytoskeletal protein RodZ